jgi:uncharacterized membrane protein
MIPDNLFGRLQLMALAFLAWLIVALLIRGLPILRLTWFGKILYLIALLLTVLGVPILQMELTFPAKSRTEINFVMATIVIEELFGILIILAITYWQRRSPH